MSGQLVRYELRDGVAVLTLNDAKRRNALSSRLLGELQEWFLQFETTTTSAWRRRAQIATTAPSSTSTSAMARPMPWLPPVTIAMRPSRPKSMAEFFPCSLVRREA